MDRSYFGADPVISIAGIMPGNSEMSHWKTAYPNPDSRISTGRHPQRPYRGQRPSISMAGVMPASPTATWATAYPCPDEQARVALYRQQRELARKRAAELPQARRPNRKTPRSKAA